MVWCVRYFVSIRDFRGIAEGEIELSRVNIILEPNNSGKSTILEALFLAPNPLRSTPYATIDARGVLRRLRAVDVLQVLHGTLWSEGYAFLLRDYRAHRCEIRVRATEEVSLLFLSEKEWIDVVISSAGRYIFMASLGKYSNNVTDGTPKTNLCRPLNPVLPGSLGISNLTYVNEAIGDSLYFHPSLTTYAWNYFASAWAEVVGPGTTRLVAKSSARSSVRTTLTCSWSHSAAQDQRSTSTEGWSED